MREIVAALLLLAAAPATAGAAEPARVDALTTMLVQDCGSCHGLTMKGGLGTPLTPDALKDRPDDALVDTILNGRPGTAMPPWGPLLSHDEAQWMVDRLKEGLAK